MTYLQSVALLLDLAPSDKVEVLRELKTHIDAVSDDLIESGMDTVEAKSEAENRMGPPAEVALRFNASHNTASWRTAFYSALPFFVWAIVAFLPATLSIKSILAAMLSLIGLVFCIFEFLRGRRPAWLATCFAATLMNTGLLWLAPIPAIITVVKTHKWRKLIIILFIFICACLYGLLLFGHQSMIGIYMALFVVYITLFLPIIFIHGVSDKNVFGNAMQSSLCMLTLYMIFNLGTKVSGYIIPLDFLLIGILVFLLTRAPKRLIKEKLLSYAVGIHTTFILMDLTDRNIVSIIFMIIQISMAIAIANWIIFSPIRNEKSQNNTIPPFAME